VDIAFISAPVGDADTALAVVVFEDGLSDEAAALDATTGGAVARAVGRRFKGARNTASVLIAPAGADVGLVLLIGGGKRGGLDDIGFEQLGGQAVNLAASHGMTGLALQLPYPAPAQAARSALGARLGGYRFITYKTEVKEAEAQTVSRVQVVFADPAAAEAAYASLAAIGDGVVLARDLIMEPANILHPEEFAARMEALSASGLEVEILRETELAALGMGALLGVGLGSVRETCLAVLQWKGDPDPAAPPVAFVGKGVTFDTGGINIKGSDGLEEMKADMGGAAAIAGAMLALAGRKAKVNAVGVLCLVENMVDGAAQRPGDIVTSMSGRTIEVINTDAEGRLALADGLWYCQDRFKPRVMVDAATLTGAVMIALGLALGGLYTEDDALAEALTRAGQAEDEPLWRLPMPAVYDRHIESLTADVRNLALGIGRFGGASIAARFLKPFAGSTPWAHLDISGPAWPTMRGEPTRPPGASGYGVRLLHRFADPSYDGAA
jgi:leucyl aminopeptidase